MKNFRGTSPVGEEFDARVLALASPAIEGYVPQARRIERWIGLLVWSVLIAVLLTMST